MIPKIIHYCWLSNDPIPEKLQEYMASWKKYLPDYEFMKWDFNRFPKESCPWVSEAFDAKKYAFAADYIRIYALYKYGGIYLDMDVEVVKSFDDLLKFPYFLCYEYDHGGPEVAAFGSMEGCEWMRVWLDYYKNKHFVDDKGLVKSDSLTPLPLIFNTWLPNHGYHFENIQNPSQIKDNSQPNDQETICLLPADFFSPKSGTDGQIYRTARTYSIHHFAGTWTPKRYKIEASIWKFFGLRPRRLLWHLERVATYLKYVISYRR